MEYEVVLAHYLHEQDIWLDPGVRFFDGELDPDIPPVLLEQGIIVAVKPVEEVEPEPLPVEEVVPELPAEPTPPKARRGHE